MGKPKRDDSHVVENVTDDVVGGSEFKRSKLSYLTGVGAVGSMFGSVSRNARDAGERTSSLFRLARDGDKTGRSISSEIQDEHDRFAAAAYANNLGEQDIVRAVRVTYLKTIMCFSALILSILLSTYWVVTTGMTPLSGLGGFVEALLTYFMVPPLAAFTFAFAYTNWQFRHRVLAPVRRYITSGDIRPRREAVHGPKSNHVALTSALFIAVMVAAVASPSLGYADTNTSEGAIKEILKFDGSANDLFMRMLSYIIPDTGPIPNSEFSTSLQYAGMKNGFRALCNSLLFLGGVMFAWQFLAAVVQSTRDGTMLGKGFHQVWAPVRMVIGFGMLAPMAGGLCAAQIVVLYLVAVGSNLGNVVWRPYIETVTMQSKNRVSDATEKNVAAWNQPAVIIALNSIFEKELCLSTIRSIEKRTGEEHDGWTVEPASLKFEPPNDSWFDRAAWVDWANRAPGYVYKRVNYGEICGYTELAYRDPTWVDKTVQYGSNIGNGNLVDLSDAAAGALMAEAHEKAILAVMPKLRELADKAAPTYTDYGGQVSKYFASTITKEQTEEILTVFARAKDEYDNIIIDAARDIYNKSEDGREGKIDLLRKSASAEGWAGAGMFYVALARLQNSVYERAVESAVFTPIDYEGLRSNADIPRQLVGATESDVGALSDYNRFYQKYYKSINAVVPGGATTVANDEITMGGKWMTAMTSMAVSFWEKDLSPNPLNPMQDLVEMGNKMTGYGMAIYLASSATEFVSAAGEKLTDGVFSKGGPQGRLGSAVAGTIAQTVAGIASMGQFFGLALIAVGVTFAFVIPMIPYIYVTFFVAAMVILVAEALVAAPIWAFMHIRMDGEQFVEQVQRPGYMIIFNLLLRPAMMVFAVILSYVVYGATSYFLAYTFVPAMHGLGSSSSIGGFGMIAMIVIITYLHFLTAIRSFKLINSLPDRVSRWFGSSPEGTSEHEDSNTVTTFLYGQANASGNLMRSMTIKPKSNDDGGKGVANASGRQAAASRPQDAQEKPKGIESRGV